MEGKIMPSLTAIIFSLLAFAVPLKAEMPLDYTSWPVWYQSSDGKVWTYRTNRKPDARVVREFRDLLAKFSNGEVVPFTAISYSPKSNPDPKQNPLEIDARIEDTRYKGIRQAYDAILGYAKNHCGSCHPIIDQKKPSKVTTQLSGNYQ